MVCNAGTLRFRISVCLILFTLFSGSCNKSSNAVTAFYYWKQSFQLGKKQQELSEKAGNNRLYIRFFDIKWNTSANLAYPEAIINFKQRVNPATITPVIFITNQTFEKLDQKGVDSLAAKCNDLMIKIAADHKITYQTVQFDCDWTIGTRERYFDFLKAFKILSKKQLEATIRLHQVKYQFKTGVPPVDRGILMFYNMGKITANPEQPNSIYNAKDAETYISSMAGYLLPLDIALPLFSWSIHIRDGKVIQVYGKIRRVELNNQTNFTTTAHKNVYAALKSFFISGIYIKQGDLLKLEETDKIILNKAAVQLAAHLNKDEKRTIIYYELGNLNFSAFKTEDFKKVSNHF